MVYKVASTVFWILSCLPYLVYFDVFHSSLFFVAAAIVIVPIVGFICKQCWAVFRIYLRVASTALYREFTHHAAAQHKVTQAPRGKQRIRTIKSIIYLITLDSCGYPWYIFYWHSDAESANIFNDTTNRDIPKPIRR